MLADLLSDEATKSWIVTYHEHTALLENIEEERLNEVERKQAWEEYEAVKAGRRYGNKITDQALPNFVNRFLNSANIFNFHLLCQRKFLMLLKIALIYLTYAGIHSHMFGIM